MSFGHKFFLIFNSWSHWIKNQQVCRYNMYASITAICTTYWKIQDQAIQPPCTKEHRIRCAGKCKVNIIFYWLISTVLIVVFRCMNFNLKWIFVEWYNWLEYGGISTVSSDLSHVTKRKIIKINITQQKIPIS